MNISKLCVSCNKSFFAFVPWKMNTLRQVTNYDEEAPLTPSDKDRKDFLRERASLESTLGFMAMDEHSQSFLEREAKKYQIMTAPGIVINGKLEFTGVPSKEELRKKLR